MRDENGACPLCGGHKEPGRTTVSFDLEFGVVVVRHVPALVCDQCGENWLEDRVAGQLEDLVRRARENHSMVEVADWDEMVKAA
ncbi:MAG: type II toxin-antitoxin system MqsA family antitoxin [Gammaproteobacteria bacterium]|nr:type II toxin-antitoxin system MqsA family antitoxin [Gammaproteobacteria bacterium]MBU1655379.1 type II toxin-antitoxin system MqsA family antitoxin [Gammaproteobacteria bacterium]MBU1960357.1 type II toxin-antitoxin system MqsA family antitoxin [Gammaproteobacteria bacterium]